MFVDNLLDLHITLLELGISIVNHSRITGLPRGIACANMFPSSSTRATKNSLSRYTHRELTESEYRNIHYYPQSPRNCSPCRILLPRSEQSGHTANHTVSSSYSRCAVLIPIRWSTRARQCTATSIHASICASSTT